jgi:hypothetical protein
MTRGNRIFLAHASEDKAHVRQLHADLKARSLHPWLDEIDLLPGQIWRDEIPKAIREAAVFLACLSRRSVDKVGFIQNEFRLALSALGERPPGSIYLIPVRLDDCVVPNLQIASGGLNLQDIQWVDLWQEGGLDRLVVSIKQALAGTPPPRVDASFPAKHVPSSPIHEALSNSKHAKRPNKDRAAAKSSATIDRQRSVRPGRPPQSRLWSLSTSAIVAAIVGVGAIAVVAATLISSPLLLNWFFHSSQDECQYVVVYDRSKFPVESRIERRC